MFKCDRFAEICFLMQVFQSRHQMCSPEDLKIGIESIEHCIDAQSLCLGSKILNVPEE